MTRINEIIYIVVSIGIVRSADDYQLYFHFFGYYCFYVNACVAVYFDTASRLSKTCEIGCELNKNSVIFNRAYYAGYRFALFKTRYVLFPCTEKLFVCKANARIFNAFDDGFYLLTNEKSV